MSSRAGRPQLPYIITALVFAPQNNGADTRCETCRQGEDASTDEGATMAGKLQAEEASDPCASVLHARPDRPFVVAQLGQSLDGRIATVTGESRWINQASALQHVHRLRATVDAVVVGVGTVIADDPLLDVRRVEGRNPARVVIDPTGRCPATARVLMDSKVRRVVVRAQEASSPLPPGVEEIRIAAHGRTLAPRKIIEALFAAGLRTMLVEGGSWTVSQFIDADAVDRLHVMVSPVILGTGKHGLQLRPIARLADAHRPRTEVHVLAGGDVLFDCDLRQCWEGETV
jgi:diaminohydroxyphosphoribosylaminopyrimidine deaminase/5-amino-6-(5-phosphoribosylamino)uracil reductase